MSKIIKNVTQFTHAIYVKGNKKHCQNYFRGHSSTSHQLIPSIYRNGLIDNEDVIFKEAISLTPSEFLHHKSTLERLVKMQHYGIPTRLLDITSNPLVALYFACSGSPELDGEVVFLQIPDEYIRFYDSDTVSVVANISRRPSNFEIDSSIGSIEEFNETHHIGYLLHEIKEEKPYFQSIINPRHLEEVFAVKVKLDNPRILKQNGAFLLFGINVNKSFPAEVPSSWVVSSDEEKIIIPASKKQHILKNLGLIGIDSSTLFPEIEYQGKFLTNKYKK